MVGRASEICRVAPQKMGELGLTPEQLDVGSRTVSQSWVCPLCIRGANAMQLSRLHTVHVQGLTCTPLH